MMHAYRLSKGTWILGTLSVAVGLVIGAFVIGLSIVDPPLEWFLLLVLASILAPIAVGAGKTKRFLVALIVLDVSLKLDIQLFSQPIDASVDGLWVSLTSLSLLVLYGLWTIELLTGRAKIDPCVSVSLPALCFIATGLLSVHNSKAPILSALELALNAELFLMYFYLANHLQDLDDFRFISRVLLAGLLIVALSILAMYFLEGFRFMGLGGETLEMGSERFVRSGGLLKHPNVAATYLVPISMMALAILVSVSEANFGRLLALVSLPLGVVALILTFSRGGWVSFAVAGLVFTLLALRRKLLRWQHVVPLIAVLGLLVFLFHEPILHRLLVDDYGSALSRIPLSIIALNMIKAHPWIGVGINNFMVVVKQYLTPGTYGAWLAPVHNKYLLVWSETGTIGILSFILFYLAIGKEAWQCYKSDHPVFSPLGAALLAGLCGYATHMMLDRFGSRSALQLLWLIAAIAYSMRRLRDVLVGDA